MQGLVRSHFDRICPLLARGDKGNESETQFLDTSCGLIWGKSEKIIFALGVNCFIIKYVGRELPAGTDSALPLNE